MADEQENEALRTQRDAAQHVAKQAAMDSTVHRVERDIALDVADGTATERDIALAQRNRLAAESSLLAGQRDAAFQHAAVEEAEAQTSTTAFYVLLAVVVLALIVIAAVYLNRPNPEPSAVIVPARTTVNTTPPP